MIRDFQKIVMNSRKITWGLGVMALVAAAACASKTERTAKNDQRLLNFFIVVQEGERVLFRPSLQVKEGKKASVELRRKGHLGVHMDLVAKVLDRDIYEIRGTFQKGKCTKESLRGREKGAPFPSDCVENEKNIVLRVREGQTAEIKSSDSWTYQIKVTRAQQIQQEKTVSLELQRESLKKLFSQLSEQTQKQFIVAKNVDMTADISFKGQNMSMSMVLDIVGESHNFDWRPEGKKLIKIFKKAPRSFYHDQARGSTGASLEF